MFSIYFIAFPVPCHWLIRQAVEHDYIGVITGGGRI